MDEVPRHEKRRSPRIERNWFVHCKRADSLGPEWSVGRVKNLSASGVCFSLNERFEVETKIKMKFNLPLPIFQLLRGRIVWRREVRTKQYEYGISFEDVKPEDKAALMIFVNKLLKKR